MSVYLAQNKLQSIPFSTRTWNEGKWTLLPFTIGRNHFITVYIPNTLQSIPCQRPLVWNK